MERRKFKLTSDQLELLMAFESSRGLGHLSEVMAKDPSVVSRNLQRMAEVYPVLEKVKGRWEITPLGKQINLHTASYLEKHNELLSKTLNKKSLKSTHIPENSVLIIINAQKALLDATQDGRNNSEAERNIFRLLEFWRSKKRHVVHVKHVSENPSSHFFRSSAGGHFIEALSPQGQEHIVEKTKSSAFSHTNLEALLKGSTSVVLAGFTANECIDASARDAASLGFEVHVVGDASATFDLRDPSGKLIKAERVHKLTLANLNAFYAQVLNTDEVLKSK